MKEMLPIDIVENIGIDSSTSIELDTMEVIENTVPAIQSDHLGRKIKVSVKNEGRTVDLTNAEVLFYCKKKDGTVVYNNTEIINAAEGLVEVILTEQILAIQGDQRATLVIREGDKRVQTYGFNLRVDAGVYDENAIVSSNEFNALTNTINDVNQIKDELKDKSGRFETLYTDRLNEIDVYVGNMITEYDNTNIEIEYPTIHNDVEDLKQKVDYTGSQLDNMGNELPLKLDKIGGKVSKTNMYGTKNNACILNVNNTNRDADVLNLTSFKGLAQYVDRDIVNIYSHSEAPMGIRLKAISFSETSVTFATGIDLSNIKIGMYIDCYNSDYYNPNDKYSGFIKEINGNVITVDGWGKYNYLVNGEVPNGQIPPSSYNFVVINGATKTWVVNYNASLTSNSLAKKAVIAEYGLFNSKSETDKNADVSGIDIVNFKGKSQFGIRIRKKSNSTGEIANGIDTAGVNYGFVNNSAEHTAFKNKTSGERGFCNDSSKNGFINLKASEIGFQNVSAPIGFTTSGLDSEKGYRATDKSGNEYLLTTGSGKYRKLSFAKSVITSDTTLNLEDNVMFYISGARNITLPPCTHALDFRIFKVFSTGESVITSTSDIKNTATAVKTLTLTPYKMYEMFTDGTTWFIV